MKKQASAVAGCWPFVSLFAIPVARDRKKAGWMVMLVMVCVGGGLVLSTLPVRGADKNQRDVIRRASAAYYSLKGQGLLRCQCQVGPDWDALYSYLNPDAGAPSEVLQLLKQTRFQVAIGQTGASAVSHEADYAPPNEEVAQRLREVTVGLEQLITGFFQIWSPLTFDSPFPDADSEFQLEDSAGQYRLAYQQGATQVVTTFAGDYAIKETEVKGPQMSVDLHLEWGRMKGVYILSSFKGRYQAGSAGTQELAGTVTYQELDGLEFPSKLVATVSTPTRAVKVPIAFTDCRVSKQ